MPDGDMNMGYLPDVPLRRLAGQLAAEGMEIREFLHGAEVIEISVRNPRDPDRGDVVMGYDGYLTWEYWSALRADSDVTVNADIIRVLLKEDINRRRKPAGTAAACRDRGYLPPVYRRWRSTMIRAVKAVTGSVRTLPAEHLRVIFRPAPRSGRCRITRSRAGTRSAR